jgi:hypothetical protein
VFFAVEFVAYPTYYREYMYGYHQKEVDKHFAVIPLEVSANSVQHAEDNCHHLTPHIALGVKKNTGYSR